MAIKPVFPRLNRMGAALLRLYVARPKIENGNEIL